MFKAKTPPLSLLFLVGKYSLTRNTITSASANPILTSFSIYDPSKSEHAVGNKTGFLDLSTFSPSWSLLGYSCVQQ